MIFKKKNKIFIPFHHYSSIGGPSTFMRNLKLFLDDVKFSYVDTIQDADIIFFPITYDIAELDAFKRRGGKIIQRLDGIYYPSKHGDNYLALNHDIREIYLYYADHVIFQSEYSLRQCFEMFGPCKKYSIIHNGADSELFHPSQKLMYGNTIRMVTTGNFRNLDMIEPVVRALDLLWEERKDFVFHVIGPIINDGITQYITRDYIEYHSSMELSDIASFLRDSDIFIYSHLNPPCPNSVIEAISSGLPVVGFDSGAMKELLHFAPELLAKVSESIFQKYSSFDYNVLYYTIKYCIQNLIKYKKKARKHSRDYCFSRCGKKYLKSIKSV